MLPEPKNSSSRAAQLVEGCGRAIALAGVVLPLLLIGGLKFTQTEIEALKPLIGGTPWLAWMLAVFGPAWSSYVLGVIELATGLLLLASPWSRDAALIGSALAALTFAVTTSLMIALPVWDTGSGGFPALNGLGQFLIKDIALLGISLVILGDAMATPTATGSRS